MSQLHRRRHYNSSGALAEMTTFLQGTRNVPGKPTVMSECRTARRFFSPCAPLSRNHQILVLLLAISRLPFHRNGLLEGRAKLAFPSWTGIEAWFFLAISGLLKSVKQYQWKSVGRD